MFLRGVILKELQITILEMTWWDWIRLSRLDGFSNPPVTSDWLMRQTPTTMRGPLVKKAPTLNPEKNLQPKGIVARKQQTCLWNQEADAFFPQTPYCSGITTWFFPISHLSSCLRFPIILECTIQLFFLNLNSPSNPLFNVLMSPFQGLQPYVPFTGG